MARNKLAGTKTGKSRSARYYQDNPEARRKKLEYDKKFGQNKNQRKKRAILVKENRDRGTYGNHDGKDLAHYKGSDGKLKVKEQDQSKNRGDKKRIYFKVKKPK